MDQTNQAIPDETNNPEPAQRTSIGLKLTLISVGVLLVAFIMYAIISIRIGQGALLTSLQEDLGSEVSETNDLIRSKLLEVRTIANIYVIN